jgi:glycosyltransferase involved in cell wall biosynthesis
VREPAAAVDATALAAGLLYHSFVEPSGYGLAGIAYVRALVNAGVPVRWVPVRRVGEDVRPALPGETVSLSLSATDDQSLSDLPALLAATCRPIAIDTVIAHTVPEHWPTLFQPGLRNVGMTVWETDRLPAHWRPLLDRADDVVVPCTHNRDVFVASGMAAPVHVVPHVRRHAWNAFTPDEIASARTRFALDEARFVFYTINAWDPRKALPRLLRAFVHAFSADDGVALVVKTGALGFGAPPDYASEATLALAQAAVDAATDEVDRDAPTICMLPYELTGRGVDLVHELGDAYVSLTHGEGWAIGMFDAATRGTPVIATGWGGHLDYLGDAWPGAVPWRYGAVPAWPPLKPSYWPSQRWAVPDMPEAIRMMRGIVDDASGARAAAAAIAERIANRYAEPRVASELMAALA